MIVDIGIFLRKKFEKFFEIFFEKKNIFYFFTRIIYIPMAVKSDSNYIIIVYYCNTIQIVNNKLLRQLFTIIYYWIGRSTYKLHKTKLLGSPDTWNESENSDPLNIYMYKTISMYFQSLELCCIPQIQGYGGKKWQHEYLKQAQKVFVQCFSK